MGIAPCTGESACRVFVSEIHFDIEDRLALSEPVEFVDDEDAECCDRILLTLLGRRFRSTNRPVTELHPHILIPDVASIAKETMVPRFRHDDPDHCCRIYVVNFRDNTQRIFMCEGFGNSVPRHTRLPDLWDVLRSNPAFLRTMVSVL